MQTSFKQLFVVFLSLLLICNITAQVNRVNLLEDLKTLSSDEFGGRVLEDNALARDYLIDRLGDAIPAYTNVVDTFGFLDYFKKKREGKNIVVKLLGTKYPDHYLVLSAHYDHLGTSDGEIYNGADDNGSGTAALLALYEHFNQNPPQHSIIFAFFDAEEVGLRGADRFVEDPPVPRGSILMNINMDMISRNDKNTINVCGTYDFPKLKGPLKKAMKSTDLSVTRLHEGPKAKSGDDWTEASDHGEFLKRGIPYLYFGVEDHPGYHDPTDDFELINQDFYFEAVKLVKVTTEIFDQKLKTKRLD